MKKSKVMIKIADHDNEYNRSHWCPPPRTEAETVISPNSITSERKRSISTFKILHLDRQNNCILEHIPKLTVYRPILIDETTKFISKYNLGHCQVP